MVKAKIPQIMEVRPDDWVAMCPVCDGAFVVRAAASKDNPAPHGSFCPDCQANKLIAPGVLSWSRRSNIDY